MRAKLCSLNLTMQTQRYIDFGSKRLEVLSDSHKRLEVKYGTFPIHIRVDSRIYIRVSFATILKFRGR